MKFTVVWTPVAEKELAELWLATSDKAEVTRVAQQVERQLKLDPENTGESRVGRVRILLEPPLGFVFSVSPDDRLVKVVHVAWARRR